MRAQRDFPLICNIPGWVGEIERRIYAEPNCAVAITADYRATEFFHTIRKLTRGRVLLIQLGAKVLWLGPLLEQGETACIECLTEWMRLTQPPPAESAEGPIELALSIVAATINEVFEGRGDLYESRLREFSLRTFESRSHFVTRRPNCPACGDPALPSDTAISFRKPVTRSLTPGEVVARLERFVSPITGFINRVEAHETNHGILAEADWIPPHAPDVPPQRRPPSPQRAWAFATSATAAKAACLGEAVERYSLVAQGDEPSITAPWSEVRDRAIHPKELNRFTEHQYEIRTKWNRSGFPWIPPAYRDCWPMCWTTARSLCTNKDILLPEQFCYFASARHDTALFFASDSNGCAAGGTLEEAIFHAFLELVERDAIAIWWYNQLSRPAVEPRTATSPELLAIIAAIGSCAREWSLIDLTTDLGIPVIAAISRRGRRGLGLGFGAHPDAQIAATRALRECAQMGLPGASSDRANLADAATARFLRTATLHRNPHFVPTRPARSFQEYPVSSNAPMNLRACIDAARRCGIDLFFKVHTRPEVGLPVARVCSTTLVHPWHRLASRRLYEVPVRLGWLDRPRTEDELNPAPYCF